MSHPTSKTKAGKLRKEGVEFKMEYAKLFEDVSEVEQKIHKELAACVIDNRRKLFQNNL